MNAVARFGAGMLLVALCGCQATPDTDKFFRNDYDHWSGGEKMMTYARDVGYDFCDIFTVDLGWGKTANGAITSNPIIPAASTIPFFNWVFFNVHVTKYAEIGFGNWSGYKAGMLGRGMGVWREERYEGGFGLGVIQNYSVHAARVPTRGNQPLATRYMEVHGYDIDLDQNYHWGDVGLSFHFFILPGFDLNLSPFEALDFVFGVFNNYPNPVEMTGTSMPWDIGTDIADDDTRPSLYDHKLGRARYSDYSIWPTIWPTTFGHHEEVEGGEAGMAPISSPATGSVGGAYGGDKSH